MVFTTFTVLVANSIGQHIIDMVSITTMYMLGFFVFTFHRENKYAWEPLRNYLMNYLVSYINSVMK